MSCAPGHRGPANVHVHNLVPVYQNGYLAARLCECGEGFSPFGEPLTELTGKLRTRTANAIVAALRSELIAQGYELPPELTDQFPDPESDHPDPEPP